MYTITWRRHYPELERFLEEEVRPVVDAYGETYLNAMDQAQAEYGWEGVEMQLPYIACNLRRGNKDIEKRIIDWKTKLEADRDSR